MSQKCIKHECFAVLQVLIFHGKTHNFYFISIIRVQQFYIIVDILYIT